MRGKLFSFLVLAIILTGLIWYLFLKGYNYKLTFETSLPPGAVYASLSNWERLKPNKEDSITFGKMEPFKEISYSVIDPDSTFNFNWKINRTPDDRTQVVTYVSDLENSLVQNLTVPFKKNDFVHRSVSEATYFLSYLKKIENNYEVKILSDSIYKVPAESFLYIRIKSRISEKANEMANYITYIMGFIRQYDIPLDGNPFIQVNKIDFDNNVIEYDFCFPVKIKDDIPIPENIYYKETSEFNAIKASFRGNYRDTEFAWYELIDYARRNKIDVENTPLEIYLNDPQGGTNSTEWLADIYLPLKQ